MATFTSNTYDGRYLQLTIGETTDAATNTSTLTWTLSSVGGASSYYAIDATTVTINGTQVYYKARTAWDERVFPAAKGSVSGTIDVEHDSDGTKTIDVSFITSVYIYGQNEYGGSMTLTNIDQTTPTISVSISSITASSLYISASASAVCDVWQYSLNGGSTWSTLSSTASASASKTISSLSPNTSYKVRVRGRKRSNQLYGYSSTTTVTTLGGALLNSVSEVTADAATAKISLNATVYSASYIYTLAIKNGSTTYLTISGLSWTAGTADRTVTLTAAQRTTLLTAMASIKSFSGTFSLTTFNGSTQVGSEATSTATVTTTVANSGPSISGFTFEDSNATTVAITGNNQLFVQAASTLKVTPGTATAKNGASITNYTATCNGVSASNSTGAAITVGKVTKSGEVAVVLTVTDSRGYTASVTQNITAIAYAKPKLSEVSIRRTNDIEAEMRLEFNGSISALTVGGVQKNSLQYARYRYKLTSATSYGSYTNILSAVTVSGTSFSYSNPELCNLDANSSYDFHLQIQDKFGSSSSLDLYFVIPQGTPLLALRKGKVGVNTPNPDAALHVVGTTHLEGATTIGGATHIVGDTRIEGTLTPDNLNYTFPDEKPYYGTCATAAATAAKVVTCSGFKLKSGALIAVQFTNANTASSPSMNVNSTGAIAICGIHGTYISTNMWIANQIVLFVYNGSYWVAIGSVPATTARYGITKLSSSVSSTSTSLAATPSAVKQAYDRNSWDSISLTNALALAYGGTGATSAAGARTNLGITCTSLYSGTLTTGSTTFNYGNYKAYLIIGQPSSAGARVCVFVPAAQITTTATAYQFADESYYYSFNLSYSGTTVTLAFKGRSSSGQIIKIFGVN